MKYEEVKRWSYEYNQELQCDDSRFKQSCMILHQDGSNLFFQSAFLVLRGDWVCCFTEHHGFHIYHREDLIRYQEFQRAGLVSANGSIESKTVLVYTYDKYLENLDEVLHLARKGVLIKVMKDGNVCMTISCPKAN